MASTSRSLAFAALVLTSALWGSNSVVARGMIDVVPPMALAFSRWVVVLLIVLPFVWPERKLIAATLRKDWRLLLPLALFGFAPQNAFMYSGLAGTTAIHVGLLNSAIPVLIVIITAVWMGRRPLALEGIGLTISLAGVLLILVHGDPRALMHLALNPYDVIVLAAMVVWAVYTVKLKDRPQQSLLAFVFCAGLLGQLFMLPAVAIELAIKGAPVIGMREAIGVLYLGTLPTLVAMLCFSYGVERVGPVQASIFTHLVPVFSVLFASMFLGEKLYPYHAVGFLFVAGGAVLCCLRPEPVLSSPPSKT